MTSTTATASTFSGNGAIARAILILRELAPYAAIELCLPGGSLIALGLWFIERRQRRKASMYRKPLGLGERGVHR